MPTISPLQRLIGCALQVATATVTGCATIAEPVEPSDTEEVFRVPELDTPELIPVVRYGRYSLVELTPTPAQRDLLLQIVDVSMPEDARASVGDGLRHVLKRSGYQLCETPHTVIELYSLPLPAAHLQLGPMTLRDALLTLAGPAWDLHVDDRARQVCFVRVGEDDVEKVPDSGSPSNDTAQSFPIMEGQP
ncbi:integrating conjugative element protein pill, pfgi-1 [Pseudomonas nabeulensis]|uniref:Integrating conjugative element protein pill, pfgi-1 n=2 Tax=Pseudomonas TaxID=286 RepID=A0A4Z0B1P8_9PSED|nr:MULTISPECIES: PilL N-terminal domain-containing protein [Pseudomonas]MQT88088.1 integrating conjugative element protein pill, pfgi-1 [Pseudomonas helleri]TFY92885.1 integrating conjugative element protein pill, pfgi-1 [Pseudomonas nabeulensis]